MKTVTRLHLTALLLAGLAMPVAFAQEGRSSHFTATGNELIHHRVNVDGHAAFGAAPTVGSTSALSSTNKLSNHGGQVMTTPTVYVIWYGNWAQSNGTDNASGQQIVTDFFQAIGGSPYYKINSTYTSSGITGNVVYGGATSVAYPYGASLTDANIQTIVSDAIVGAHLPNDAAGLYFVLTSSDVNEASGFCTQYLRLALLGHRFRLEPPLWVHRQCGPLHHRLRRPEHRAQRQCRRGRHGLRAGARA